jgi:hypothetical protein
VGINRNRDNAGATAAKVPGIQGEKVKRQPIERDSKAVIKLIELINAHPGLTMRQLMDKACYSISHTKNALSRISAFGEAAPVYIEGGIVGWFPMALARIKQAEWANAHERRAERAREKRKAREATLTAAKAEKARQRAEKRAAAPPTIRDRLHQLTKAPEGASAAQMMEFVRIELSSLGKHTRAMEGQGRIFRADRAGARLRYFDSAERAANWEALPPLVPSEWHTAGVKAWENNPHRPRSKKEQIRQAAREAREERRQQRLVAIGERLKSKAQQPRKAPPKPSPKFEAIKPKPAEPAPVVLKGTPSDIRGAVDYSKAKIIRDDTPKFDARYQLPPGAVVVGEFSRQWQQLRGQA